MKLQKPYQYLVSVGLSDKWNNDSSDKTKHQTKTFVELENVVNCFFADNIKKVIIIFEHLQYFEQMHYIEKGIDLEFKKIIAKNYNIDLNYSEKWEVIK